MEQVRRLNRHYNLKESFAADLLQVQPRVISDTR
jgi:hypothetical protein